MIPVIIIVAVVIVLALVVLSCYNSLVKLNQRVKEAWSDITIQLKYRADLIPNLVETVKGYAKHEKGVFTEVTEARKQTLAADKGDMKAVAEADKAMAGAIKSIYAVAEAYPELKASENFKELQGQLQEVEDKIQASRRFYNAGVKDFNSKIMTIPSAWINAIFLHFKPKDYFEVEAGEKAKIEKAPEVKF